MKTTLHMLFVVVLIAWASAQDGLEVSTKESGERIRICESQSPSMQIIPIRDQTIRTILEVEETPSIIVEPSARIGDSNNAFDVRFDYRIVTGADQHVFKISDFGKTPEEREEIAYRRLESIGISCLSRGKVLIYLSFSVNGSRRDYFYVGLHVTGASGQPLALGRSAYGVLSMDKADPSCFSIWDSTLGTAANGMGSKHVYEISSFQCEPDRQSVQLLGHRTSKSVYPGRVMGDGEVGIRVDDALAP